MKLGLVGMGAAMLVSLVGCGGVEGQEYDEGSVFEVEQALLEDNGWEGDNGAIIQNGLPEMNGSRGQNGSIGQNGSVGQNGLSMQMALTNVSNLPDGQGLLATATGRKILKYLIKCALPAGVSITRKDDSGTDITFHGAVGAGKEKTDGTGTDWATGVCDEACQERITACMGAHVNMTGNSVQIYLVGDGSDGQFPFVGPGLDQATYPNMEGAFFGNIFKDPPEFYYCNGPDVGVNTVPGRIGSGYTAGYSNPYSGGGTCAANCTAISGNAGSGWGSCANPNDPQKPWNYVLNVWRQ